MSQDPTRTRAEPHFLERWQWVTSSLLTETEKKSFSTAERLTLERTSSPSETEECVSWSVGLCFLMFPSLFNNHQAANSPWLASFPAAEQGGRSSSQVLMWKMKMHVVKDQFMGKKKHLSSRLLRWTYLSSFPWWPSPNFEIWYLGGKWKDVCDTASSIYFYTWRQMCEAAHSPVVAPLEKAPTQTPSRPFPERDVCPPSPECSASIYL